MILALLLQITLFNHYTQQAAAKLGVRGVTVEESVVSYNHARHLAWINDGSFVIHIGYDVTRVASPQVLQYLAYHEVCHLKLGHNLYPTDPQIGHMHVTVCMQQALGVQSYLEVHGVFQTCADYVIRLRLLQFGSLP